MFIVLQVFVLTVHADDMDDDEFAIEQGMTSIHQHGIGFDESVNDYHKQRHQQQEHMFPENHHSKKYQTGKHISVQAFVARAADFHFASFYETIVHVPAAAKGYHYIFFREINPPPPKVC